MASTLKQKLPTAEEEIGKIVATAKEGTHKLMQNAQSIPNPETYLDVKIHVEKWSIVGKQLRYNEK